MPLDEWEAQLSQPSRFVGWGVGSSPWAPQRTGQHLEGHPGGCLPPAGALTGWGEGAGQTSGAPESPPQGLQAFWAPLSLGQDLPGLGVGTWWGEDWEGQPQAAD